MESEWNGWPQFAEISTYFPFANKNCSRFNMNVENCFTWLGLKQGTRKLVSGGIRIPDNPMLVRQTVFKATTKTSWAEGPALTA